MFERSGASWVLAAKLYDATGGQPDDFFGSAVALDGDRALVGAPGRDDVALDGGAVYVFERVAGVWTQTGLLASSALEYGDWLGYSVALDGEKALVGAPWTYNDFGPALPGQAYVFELGPAGWAETARLEVAAAWAQDMFGWSVSLRGDVAVVGAPWAETLPGVLQTGLVHVYQRTSDLAQPWAKVATLSHPAPASYDSFGSAVSASDAGILVGVPRDDDAGSESGSALWLAESAATESVRLGTPPNPFALLPGVTSGPVLGATWDPVIDHTTFLPGATLDLLGITVNPLNVPLPPFGTLLCDPTVIAAIPTSPAGVPFAIPVPYDCALAGASLCTQGASLNAAGNLLLTNALDLVLGTF